MIERPSARLLIVDANKRLLLFKFEPKAGPLTGKVFWATPGGGLDPGESYAQAACRELYEEVGLRIDDAGPEIAQRDAIIQLPSGEMAHADERFFMVRVDRLDLSQEGWTELERDVMTAHRWWTPNEIHSSTEQIWPENITEILVNAGVW